MEHTNRYKKGSAGQTASDVLKIGVEAWILALLYFAACVYAIMAIALKV